MLRGSLETPMEYTDFNNWLQGICSNVFTDINDYLMQSGYQVRGFTSLKDPYLRVSNISCSMMLELTRKLNLEEHLKCLSAILANEPNVKIRKDGESYRYKRVEHFQVMNEEEEYVSQLLKLSQDKTIVERELKRRFPEKSDN